MSAPRACRLELLQEQDARALAHHEAGPRRVERARRVRRMLFLRGEPAHRAEAREDQRVDARLGAAGEHGVRVAALDQLGRLADRVRARRARRDDRVVRAADPERDRDLPARRVDEHVREEVRRDAVGAALAQDVGLLDDPDDPADRRAEHDPHPRRVEAVQARVADRLLGRRDGEQHVALEPARLLRRHDPGRVEVLHLRRDAHRKRARVERADPVDPALPLDRGPPRRGRVVAERRDRAEPCDDDPAHEGQLKPRTVCLRQV